MNIKARMTALLAGHSLKIYCPEGRLLASVRIVNDTLAETIHKKYAKADWWTDEYYTCVVKKD